MPVPEIIEVPVVERVRIPAELLADCRKSPVPDDLTYGEAMVLWAQDRATIDTCQGQIKGLRVLNEDAD